MKSSVDMYLEKMVEWVRELKLEVERLKNENYELKRQFNLKDREGKRMADDLKGMDDALNGYKNEFLEKIEEVRTALYRSGIIKPSKQPLDDSGMMNPQVIDQMKIPIQKLTSSLEIKDQLIERLRDENKTLADKNTQRTHYTEKKFNELIQNSFEKKNYERLKEAENTNNQLNERIMKLDNDCRMKDFQYSLLEQDLKALTS